MLVDKMLTSEFKEVACLNPHVGTNGGPKGSVKESFIQSKGYSLQMKHLCAEFACQPFQNSSFPEAPGLLEAVGQLEELCISG